MGETKIQLTVLCCLFFVFAAPQDFDQAKFYAIMADGKIEIIENELKAVSIASIKEKEAYQAALLMRKAGLLTVPALKLKWFKEGRIKLETAISKDSTNGEYRFLRLMIQEHAPKITKYRGQLNDDKQLVLREFSTLTPALRQAIVNYSKTSAVLTPQDL